MQIGHLDQIETYEPLLRHPIWKKAFDWLLTYQNQPPDDGEYEIEGHDLRIIVQTIDLKPRSERAFEAHQREIDLHYCFAGSELIEWASVDTLKARTKYDTEKDFILYDLPTRAAEILMKPGQFAIFLPKDGHMPGIIAEHSKTRKIVIKINAALLKNRSSL